MSWLKISLEVTWDVLKLAEAISEAAPLDCLEVTWDVLKSDIKIINLTTRIV